MRFVYQFVFRHLHHRFVGAVAHDGVPVGKCQICVECLELCQCSLQHAESDVQRLFVAQVLRQCDVGLRLRPEPVLSLQSGRQCGVEDLADGRHVIICNPVPHPQLVFGHDRRRVEHPRDVLYLEFRLLVVDAHRQSHHHLLLAERHDNPYAALHRLCQRLRNGVGEETVEGQRQYDVNVCRRSFCHRMICGCDALGLWGCRFQSCSSRYHFEYST